MRFKFNSPPTQLPLGGIAAIFQQFLRPFRTDREVFIMTLTYYNLTYIALEQFLDFAALFLFHVRDNLYKLLILNDDF